MDQARLQLIQMRVTHKRCEHEQILLGFHCEAEEYPQQGLKRFLYLVRLRGQVERRGLFHCALTGK